MESFNDYYNEGVFSKILGGAALAGSLLTNTAFGGTKSNLPPQPITFNSSTKTPGFKELLEYIGKHEGMRYSVYTDSKGYKTIGIGHQLVPSDKDLFLREFNGTLDFKKIYNGTSKLNLSQIYKLFSIDLNRGLRIIIQKYPNFIKFPLHTKMALIDSAFRGELHPKADKLINQGKWKEAAREYLNNAEYRKAKRQKSGVASRMEENAKIIWSTQTK